MSNCRQWNSDCVCVCVTFEIVKAQAIHHFIVVEYVIHTTRLESISHFSVFLMFAMLKVKLTWKWAFCDHLLTLMSFPTGLTHFRGTQKKIFGPRLSTKFMQFGSVARNSYSCNVNPLYLSNRTTESLHKMHINISRHSVSPNIMSKIFYSNTISSKAQWIIFKTHISLSYFIVTSVNVHLEILLIIWKFFLHLQCLSKVCKHCDFEML